MAITFNKQKGSATEVYTSAAISTVMVTNTFRLVGDILARYVYWIKGENEKDIPSGMPYHLIVMRSVSTNKDKDWVREYYPDLKCGWSYATQCITNGEVKVVNLKKRSCGNKLILQQKI